jgi:hypothetical protein
MQDLHYVDPASFFPAMTQLGIVIASQLALRNICAEAAEDVRGRKLAV